MLKLIDMKTKLIFIFILLIFVNAFSIDKNELYSSIVKKYSDAESLKIEFYDSQSNISGNIIAKNGNRYIINLAGRKIISNGNTIWNYSFTDNNVLISSFNDFDNEISIESLFFELINNFKPISLSNYSSSKGISGYKLTLHPKDGYENEFNLKNISLVISKKSEQIISIKYVQDFTTFSWDIKQIEINPDISEDEFEFEADENTEIIDLR